MIDVFPNDYMDEEHWKDRNKIFVQSNIAWSCGYMEIQNNVQHVWHMWQQV